MRTLLFTLLLCTCGPAPLFAQENQGCTPASDVEALALQSYLNNSPDEWQRALEAAKTLPPSKANHLLTAKTLYGAISTALSYEDEDAIDTYLDQMEEHLDAIFDEDSTHPEAAALYSGYLGMVIAQSPMKGMFYGKKASKMARKAVDRMPDSPITRYFLGSNLYYTPTTWGGDPELAVEHLQNAKVNSSTDNEACDWFNLQVLALLGQAQLATGDKTAARQTYLAALQLRPDFKYVKNVLLPEVDKTK